VMKGGAVLRESIHIENLDLLLKMAIEDGYSHDEIRYIKEVGEIWR
jgi:hypothetical protein